MSLLSAFRTLLAFGTLFTFLATARTPAAEPKHTDVVVYGATASGVLAAVAAAREGKTTVLLEPGEHVGGMVSGGLGATDHGNRAAIGGYAREFFERIRTSYVKQYGADSQQVKECSDGFHFEPHVAEQVFRELLKEARVEVLFHHRLDKVVVTEGKTGKVIARLRTLDGEEFAAAIWIDASYEGDLLAKAGVSYTVGREGRAQYQETIAGVQAHSPSHQWPNKISPFTENKKLLPFVQAGPAGEAGAGDKKVQAYNFRLCLTDRADDRVPFPKPDGYDPKRYELLARYLAARPGLKVGQLINPVRMPNGKTDTNNNGPFSTDYLGGNWDYPDADYTLRSRIWKDHVDYTQGFLYFLANDPCVPAPLRTEMNTWGLAKDEFTDNDNWPHQLYVRESRRMLGKYVMTQADIMEKRSKDDSVGLGSYNTDSHHVQRVAAEDGGALNEGDFQVTVKPYAIPYTSLVPRDTECENLLVPVCLSASHVAYGTVRMEPVYMILGQASGVAAALAVDDKVPVQKVSLERLQAKLKVQKALLSPEELTGPVPDGRRLDPAKLAGIVVDDAQATQTGTWTASTSQGPFVGDGYLHDGNQNKGQMRVRFKPRFPAAGRYEVFLFYSSHSNRATNVPVLVHHADGEQTISVNQRQALKDGKPLRLGVFEFKAGEDGWVEVRNDDTDGYVVADAVQFVPAK